MNSKKISLFAVYFLNPMVIVMTHASLICSTNRHLHTSSLSDASQSVILSFSSLPCDILDHNLWIRDHNTKLFEQIQPMQGAVLIGNNPLKLDTIYFSKGSMRYNLTIKKKMSKHFVYWSEYYHHVVIDNLSPNTLYYYQCIVIDKSTMNSLNVNHTNGPFKIKPLNQSLATNVDMKEIVRKASVKDSTSFHSFKTGPKPHSSAHTKVGIIADIGVFQHSKETLFQMSTEVNSLDAIFILGDIAYANSDHRIWDDWFTMMDDFLFLRNKPIYIVAGNHDAEGNLETGELFLAFETRFLMPQVAPAILGQVSKPHDTDLNLMYKLPYDFGNSYYSYIYGPSHNIVLNSYADFEPNSRQYNWMVNELKKVNRSITPWLVVLMHCPIYNTFTFHQNDPQAINAQRYLEPLFVQYRVNIVLSGHLHAYMRSKPVVNMTLDHTGPVHIIVGMSGRQANIPYKNEVPEDWVAFRDHQWYANNYLLASTILSLTIRGCIISNFCFSCLLSSRYGYATLEYINQTWARFECIHTGRADKRNLQLNHDNSTDIAYIYNQYFIE